MSNIRINHGYFNRNPVKLAHLKFMVTINENISHENLKDDKKLVDTILYKLEVLPPTMHSREQLITYLSPKTLKELRSVPMWKRFHCVALALYCARINYHIIEPCSNFASPNYTRALWASLTNETPKILLNNMLQCDLQSQGFNAAMSNIEVFIPNEWTKPVTEEIKQKIVQHYRNRYNAKRDHYNGEILPTIARISKRYASCFKNHPQYEKRFASQIRSVRYLKHQLKLYVTSFREDAPDEVSDSDPEEEVVIEKTSNSKAIENTGQDKDVRKNVTSATTPSSSTETTSTTTPSSSAETTSTTTSSSSTETASTTTSTSEVTKFSTRPLHSSSSLAKQTTAPAKTLTSKVPTPPPAPSEKPSEEASLPLVSTPVSSRVRDKSSLPPTLISRQEEGNVEEGDDTKDDSDESTVSKSDDRDETENTKNGESRRGRSWRRIMPSDFSDSDEDVIKNEDKIKNENDEDKDKTIIKQEKRIESSENRVEKPLEELVELEVVVKEEPTEAAKIKEEVKEEKKKESQNASSVSEIIIISDTEEDVLYIKRYNKNDAPPIVISDESEVEDSIDLTAAKDKDLNMGKRQTRSMKRKNLLKESEDEKKDNKKKKVE